MQGQVTIRELNREAWQEALALVWRVFLQYEAPDYTPEGVEEFRKSIQDGDYLARLRMYGAFLGETLVGVLATRNAGAHIALFFVEGAYHRRGIGRQLFEAARLAHPTGRMTVHSSPYARSVYHHLGFRDTMEEQVVNGLRFTPMERPE